MMSDTELEAELQATQAANPGDSHELYMREAWLLVALRRQAEGIATARRAQQAWQVFRMKVHSPYGGSIYWAPWNLEAAVALAEGDWSRAEQCTTMVLMDFEEQDDAGVLHELALHAQGQLHPDRFYHFSSDPARELAAFDLRAYALARVGFGLAHRGMAALHHKRPPIQVENRGAAETNRTVSGAGQGAQGGVTMPVPLPPADLKAREHFGVLVGADGVLVRDRFVPYSKLQLVSPSSPEPPNHDRNGTSERRRSEQSIFLRVAGDDVMRVSSAQAQVIEQSHNAWLATQREPPLDVAALAPGGQTRSGWLKALRRLGSMAASPYRTADVTTEQLAKMLDDVRAEAWVQAAAAIVLAASGDRTATARLRRLSASKANPGTRLALDIVAHSIDDDTIAKVLDRLHAGDDADVDAHPLLQEPTASEELLGGLDIDVGDGPP